MLKACRDVLKPAPRRSERPRTSPSRPQSHFTLYDFSNCHPHQVAIILPQSPTWLPYLQNISPLSRPRQPHRRSKPRRRPPHEQTVRVRSPINLSTMTYLSTNPLIFHRTDHSLRPRNLRELEILFSITAADYEICKSVMRRELSGDYFQGT